MITLQETIKQLQEIQLNLSNINDKRIISSLLRTLYPNATDESNYKIDLQKAKQAIPRDRIFFGESKWSKVRQLADQFPSEKPILTLQDFKQLFLCCPESLNILKNPMLIYKKGYQPITIDQTVADLKKYNGYTFRVNSNVKLLIDSLDKFWMDDRCLTSRSGGIPKEFEDLVTDPRPIIPNSENYLYKFAEPVVAIYQNNDDAISYEKSIGNPNTDDESQLIVEGIDNLLLKKLVEQWPAPEHRQELIEAQIQNIFIEERQLIQGGVIKQVDNNSDSIGDYIATVDPDMQASYNQFLTTIENLSNNQEMDSTTLNVFVGDLILQAKQELNDSKFDQLLSDRYKAPEFKCDPVYVPIYPELKPLESLKTQGFFSQNDFIDYQQIAESKKQTMLTDIVDRLNKEFHPAIETIDTVTYPNTYVALSEFLEIYRPEVLEELDIVSEVLKDVINELKAIKLTQSPQLR